MPTYNRLSFLPTAVESVLKQTYSDFELIIIDDASTDGTDNYVQGLNDSRIRYFKNEKNLERCISRNIGFEKSLGKYICFLDSDDYYLPNHLEILFDAIEKQKEPKVLFFTNSWNKDEKGNLEKRYCPPLSGNIFDYIVRYTFNPQRMCLHRDIFAEIKFDPAVYICEDVDFASRIALKYPLIQVNENTIVYVSHKESFTGGDNRKAFKELENYKRIFSKNELRNKFSFFAKNQVLSMCWFHIAVFREREGARMQMYSAIFKSFIHCPRGYNRKTNKILLVMFLYNLPLIGAFIKKLWSNKPTQ